MKTVLAILLSFILANTASISFAADESGGVKQETTAVYRTAKEQVEKLATAHALKYAPEEVKQAQADIAKAQKALESGNDRLTRDISEMAVLQARIAVAISDEKAAAEKLAAEKKEMLALEHRLNLILAGRGVQP